MRILILSFYYPPDLSAGSFRTKAMVEALMKKLQADSRVDIITTLPNRYKAYNVEALSKDPDGPITVFRLPLSKHNSGMIDQSIAFIGYFLRALKLIRKKKYDLVFATSSRLMTAFLGALIARKKRIPLYLDIRDIFTDTIKDILSQKVNFFVVPIFSCIEKFTINSATKINLVSGGFKSYFAEKYPNKDYSFITNGIDEEFIKAFAPESSLNPLSNQISKDNKQPFKVLYAGNIGEGQGLHRIIPDLAKSMEEKVVFKIIGDGGKRKLLLEMLIKEDINNVVLSSPVNREQLINEYKSADVLFLHLNKHAAFKKVLPSKIFEYAATGKPIWAGVQGFSSDFLQNNVDNVAIFTPCDAEGASKSFKQLHMQKIIRSDFVKKFSRSSTSQILADEFLELNKIHI